MDVKDAKEFLQRTLTVVGKEPAIEQPNEAFLRRYATVVGSKEAIDEVIDDSKTSKYKVLDHTNYLGINDPALADYYAAFPSCIGDGPGPWGDINPETEAIMPIAPGEWPWLVINDETLKEHKTHYKVVRDDVVLCEGDVNPKTGDDGDYDRTFIIFGATGDLGFDQIYNPETAAVDSEKYAEFVEWVKDVKIYLTPVEE
jgi:hypothetical protein